MQRNNDPFTPLRAVGGPLFPIHCPICGTRLGAYYRDGLSLRAYSKQPSEHCTRLWNFARRRTRWRDVPIPWRAADLAARMLEHEID